MLHLVHSFQLGLKINTILKLCKLILLNIFIQSKQELREFKDLMIHNKSMITFLDRFYERPHSRWDTCARFCLKELSNEGCMESSRCDHSESSCQRPECKDRLDSLLIQHLTLSANTQTLS